MKNGCKHDNMSHTSLFFYYFCDYFWGNIFRIFFEYSWKNLPKNLLIFLKSYYFIKVHVQNLAKNVIFKEIEIHLQVLLLLKNKHYNV